MALSSPEIDYCRECQHPIDAHEQINDHHDCTDFYVDPVTGEELSCRCSRTCCFEERCPGRSLTHTCCICLDQPLDGDKRWLALPSVIALTSVSAQRLSP